METEHDPFDLQRFIRAQAGSHDVALRELRAGRKRSHWMWYVFPQLQWLGFSDMARMYAIESIEEAAAYAAHPVLGQRLRECTAAVLAVDGRSAHDIFGHPDDWKFRSCMTLFEAAVPGEPLFAAALDRYFDGERDDQTLDLLGFA